MGDMALPQGAALAINLSACGLWQLPSLVRRARARAAKGLHSPWEGP